MSVRTAAALPSSFDLRATGTLSPCARPGRVQHVLGFRRSGVAGVEPHRAGECEQLDRPLGGIARNAHVPAPRAVRGRFLCAGPVRRLREGRGPWGSQGLLTGGTWGHAVSTLARWQGAADEEACPLPAAQRAGRL